MRVQKKKREFQVNKEPKKKRTSTYLSKGISLPFNFIFQSNPKKRSK